MTSTPYFNNPGVFLVQTLFGFYILAVMLRFLLQWVRADFYHPLVQFLVKLTNPPLLPMRRFIPGFMGLDMAAVVLMLALKLVELLLVLSILGHGANLPGLMVLSTAELLRLLINVFFWAVIIQAIMSWVNPGSHHPVVPLLQQLTYPILRPARNIIPPISGVDLSPILVIIVLHLIKMLLMELMRYMGFGPPLGP